VFKTVSFIAWPVDRDRGAECYYFNTLRDYLKHIPENYHIDELIFDQTHRMMNRSGSHALGDGRYPVTLYGRWVISYTRCVGMPLNMIRVFVMDAPKVGGLRDFAVPIR
jgi:hypothetical protein